MAAANNRDVKLKVSAVDNTGPGLKKAESAMRRFATAAQAAQARRAGRSAADDALKEAAANYERATAEATKFGRQLKQIENFSWSSEVIEAPEQLAANFERAREEARRTKAELDNARAGVSRFTQSSGGLAAFESRMSSVTGETRRTEVATDSLAGTMGRLAAAQRASAAATNATAGALRNQASAAAGAGAMRGPLGLRPHEMTNLSYQVNDLVTQIASGTSPMQAFAQQGGQIAQIFPKATGALLRIAPVVAIAAAALAPFVSALARTNAEAARLAAVERILKASGNAASYSAPQLARLAGELQSIGASADEAAQIVTRFVREAIDPAYLDRFAKVSGDAARVLGIDLTDAAEKVTDAFTGNADAVLSLDDELGFLTASERKQIEALRESKKDAEARTQAFDIFAKRYGDTAAQMKGPWSQILADFGAAWRSFSDWVNFIDWSKAKAEINSLLGLVRELTSALPGARTRTVDVVADDVSKAYARVTQNEATKARFLSQGNRMGAAQIDQSIQRDRGVIALGETRLAGMSLANGTSELTKPRDVADTTTRPPAAANTSTGGRDRSGDDAKRKADAQREFVASLLEENDARAFQVSLLDETERQQLVLTAMRQAEAGAAKVGLALTDAQRQSISEGVTRLYDEGKAREAIKTIEEARLNLAQQRGDVETRDAYVQRQLAADMAGATEAQRATYATILGQMYDLEASKRRQADLQKKITEQERLRAEIMQAVQFAQETGDEAGAALLLEQLAGVNTALVTAYDNMIAFWQAVGGPEAQAAILALDTGRKRVLAIGQGAVITGKQVNDAFAGTATSAIDGFAQQLAETGDVFGSLRDAFLQFAADFLRQIANMIVQQLILNAIGGGSGGSAGGNGGIGGFIAGLFKAPTKHTGGPVNSGGGLRTVGPWDFVGAQRYHGGGIVGQAPDEVPAILLRNEEVLTEDDPRHRANGGLSAGGGSVKIVNNFDPADILDKALGTEAGERTFMNFVGRNSGAFKAAIG